MSGQILGGVAGAVVGGFFGMPWLGYAIGSALAAPSPPGSPALDPGDLSFNTSAYGKHLSWGYGTHPITPVTFWSTDFVAHHHSEESGGKGGGGAPSREWITYTRSFALYLCDCTSGNEIVGVRRIRNKYTGELLYDVGDDADASTLIASSKIAGQIRIYTGSTTQDPDSLIEAHEGWAPAHRGHAYMVIEDFDHGETKQSIPLEVELVVTGDTGNSKINSIDLADFGDTNVARTQSLYTGSGEDGAIYYCVGLWGPSYINYDVQIYVVYPNGLVAKGAKFISNKNKPLAVGFSDEPSFVSSSYTWGGYIHYYRIYNGGASVERICAVNLPADGYANFSTRGRFYKRGDYIYLFSDYQKIFRAVTTQGDTYASLLYDSSTAGLPGALVAIYVGRDEIYGLLGGNVLVVWDLDFNELSQHSFVPDEAIIYTYGQASMYSEDDGIVYIWSGQHLHRIVNGVYEYAGLATSTMSASSYCGFSVTGDRLFTAVEKSHLDEMYWGRISAITDDGALLPAVADDLCARAGMSAGQYDTSLLPADTVRLAITQQRAARDWLAELAQLYAFRMRDSAGVLEFIPKGGASVATIDVTELGMTDPPQEIPPPPITTMRSQGNDLPRSVTVRYPSADADYAPGAQIYRMHDYGVGRDVVINTGHVISDQAAFNFAYAGCKEPHLERMSWQTALGLAWMHLQAGDVITLPNGDAWIKEIRQTGKSVLEFTLQAEASSAYSSGNLPAPTQSSPSVGISLAGPARLEIIDAPALIDGHTGAGYLVAACGYLSGWDGCALYVSTDGGESYSRVMGINTAAVIGSAVSVLGDGEPGSLDRVNSVTVQLVNGTLASSTLENMYAGANTAFLGDELIKFADVEYLGNNQYTLSILERGRKGTEWATSSHAAGDRFVLVNTALQRVDISTDNISQTRLIKAVSYGNDMSNAEAHEFTPAGVSLLPWPPTNARAYKSGSDWIIKCNERTRFGGELRNYVGITRDPEWNGWDLEIMNGSTVVRTVSGLSSPTYTYTSAMQVTDFGSNQTTITYRWYQLSTVMGRGYMTETTS